MVDGASHQTPLGVYYAFKDTYLAEYGLDRNLVYAHLRQISWSVTEKNEFSLQLCTRLHAFKYEFSKYLCRGFTEPPPQTAPPLNLGLCPWFGLRPQFSGASRPLFGLRPHLPQSQLPSYATGPSIHSGASSASRQRWFLKPPLIGLKQWPCRSVNKVENWRKSVFCRGSTSMESSSGGTENDGRHSEI